MIPGDIDLTQNLDFRKTKRKEIKQLPDSWNGNGINRMVYNYIDSINNTISSVSSFTISNNSTISWTIDDDQTTSSYIHDSYFTNNQLSTSIRLNSNEMYFITSNNDNHLDINFNSKSSIKHYITINSKPELDAFGNEIIPEPQIPSIPWRKYKEPIIKDIAWDMSLKHRMHDDLFIEDSIPWEEANNYGWYDLDDDKSNKFSISKAAEFISYLRGKSSTFIKRYLNRETEDNSSYLTNMNWIGIRDVIIE